MKRLTVLACIALTLTACGEPKLDGRSEESLKSSIQKVGKSLPEEKQKQFSSDMMTIAFANIDFNKIMKGDSSGGAITPKMLAELDGKTASEVAAEADSIRKERAAREEKQARAEIDDLEKKKSSANSAKSDVQKFEVVKSRFYTEKGQFDYRPKPYIFISVKNGTGVAVARAYFKGTLSSPGRAVPWLVDDFNYSISGGIEPGEVKEWNLAPNQFGEWGKVDAPADAVLTVEVIRLDGADGSPIFDASDFNQKDSNRLDKLKKQYPQ